MPTVTAKLLKSGGIVVGNGRWTMDKTIQGKKREQWRKGLAAGTALAALTLIPGCSSVPDSINPAHWYDSASGWFADEEDAPAPPEAADAGKAAAGSDDAETSARRPAPATGGLTRGLVSDRDNARYARTDLNRDGNPTRPLSGGAPVSAPVATLSPPAAARAEAPSSTPPAPAPVAAVAPPAAPKAIPPAPALAAVPAAPAVETDDTMPEPAVSSPKPAPSDSVAAQSAPESLPVPPPPPVPATASVPQPPPPVPASVAVPPPPPIAPSSASVVAEPVAVPAVPAARPVAQRPAAPPVPATETIEQAYNRRLAEFNAPVAASAPAPAPVPAAMPPAATIPATPVALTRPIEASSHVRPAQKGSSANGVHPLADYRAGGGASFQVAILSFGEGTAALPQGAPDSLKEVAALIKGGARSVRIIGYSLSSRLDVDPSANLDANRELAAERADAVARELIRLGVPARKIYAGSGTDLERARWASAAGSEATEINIDY